MADTLPFIDILPEPCLLLTLGGLIIATNSSFDHALGVAGSAIVGRDINSIVSSDRNRLKDYLCVCSRNRNFVLGSVSLITCNGPEVFRSEGAVIPSVAANSEPLLFLRFQRKQKAVAQFTLLNEKILALGKEIRHRVLVEKALRESEANFRELADAMPQIVWTARPDGTTEYFNRQWYELTGSVPQDQIGNEAWACFIHVDDKERFFERWAECVKTGRHYEVEFRFQFPLWKSARWHLGRAVAARNHAGNVVRWFGTCTDIDDQKLAAHKLEEAVTQRTASLQEALAQLEEFSYSVSHDLRAPVRAMHGYATALLADHADKLTDSAREYVERIVRAGQRMDKLILDVLTFSRVGKQEIQLEEVSLNKLLSEIIEQYPNLRPPAASIDFKPLPNVLAHEPLLLQVVSNLLGNAVKFVSEGTVPRIHIHSQPEGVHARIWFEDNGIGVDPAHQEKIFRLFERINPERQFGGTGIGLAIVRKAVERMGGKVGVESDGKNGSKFWISLMAA